MELNINTPSNNVPGFADVAELGRARARVAIGNGKPSASEAGGRIGEDHVARNDFAEKIVVAVAGTVSIALGRPDVAAFKFMAEGLIVINPPVAHG